MKNQKTLRLVESGVLLGIAVVLSMFKPFQLPFGGGITIVSMLPVVLISYRHGLKWGFFASFIYSLLQLVTSFSEVRAFFIPEDYALWAGLGIVLLDYVAAYTVLGFGGIFRNRFKPGMALCLGSITALSLRYLMHILSGTIFFGSWAEWFFTQEGIDAIGVPILERLSGWELALVYSVIYNATYMLPEIALTAVAAFAVGKSVRGLRR